MKVFTCQDIAHEGEIIQGFCLNFGCQDQRPQFCLQCGLDPKKHSNCKKDLKGFGQIQSFITKFNQKIFDLATQLNKSFTSVKIKCEEFSKQLETMQIQLVRISEFLSQYDYQQMKANLQVIKECYQYLNNQEETLKQYQIGAQLDRIKKMVQALDLDKGQQQNYDNQQDNENGLQQGIQLLNQQKWYEANENFTSYIKLSEKQQSLATFFKSICLIEMNQPGQGRIMLEQAEKINNNLYRDLLDYSDQELRKTPQNTFILIAKSYALNEEEKFHLAIEQCEKVLREQPQHLHALYRKSFSLKDLKQYSQAISYINVALKYNPQYSIGYFLKGYSLGDEGKYKAGIDCYDKTIQLDPNFAMAYNNKGYALFKLNNYNDAIACYDKAIQLEPNMIRAYNNKGFALMSLNKYSEAIVWIDKAIQLNPNSATTYFIKGNALHSLNKSEDAIFCYDKGIQLNPNDATAYFNKGNVLYSLNKYEDAIACYDKGIELDPSHAIAYFNKGEILTFIKNYSSAIENYERAIQYCQQDQDDFKCLIWELKNKQ